MKLLRAWCGPMCAAKTTGALHAARRYARQGLRVILVRPSSTKRSHETDEDKLTTKNGEVFPSFDVQTTADILRLLEEQEVDVLWIDEPNHLVDEEKLPDVVPIIRRKAILLISGLGATSELDQFGKGMAFILATADYVHWKTADCDVCGTIGTATRSLYVGEVPKDAQVRVGGAESYRPACPSCWSRLMKLQPADRLAELSVC